MPVKKRAPRNYYTIAKENGKIRWKDRDTGQVEFFDVIEGYLVRIELVEDEYEGETSMKWHFYFEDEDHSQTDVLQIGEPASAARGLLTTLASHSGTLGWISVAPYKSDPNEDGRKYTNVWVEIDGQTVDWLDKIKDNIPDVETGKVGSKTVVDDTERRKFFRGLAARIKKEKLPDIPNDSSSRDQDEAPERRPQAGTPRSSGPKKKEKPQAPLAGNQPPPPDDDDLPADDPWEDMDDDLPF